MNNKLLKTVIILLIAVLPVYNLINMNTVNEPYAEDYSLECISPEENTAYSVGEVEKRINTLKKERDEQKKAQQKEEERRLKLELMKKQLKNGDLTYRRVFSDTLIVGDSLMQGLNTYNILDSANMISMVSASLYHLENNIGTIIANNPEALVLHYGINMLGNTNSQMDWFIEMYEELLSELKSELPDTLIFVSSIFSVSKNSEASYPYVKEYNEALYDMCERMGVIYLDNSHCLTGTEEYYGTDGVHVSKSFYGDVWLPHVFSTLYEYGAIL